MALIFLATEDRAGNRSVKVHNTIQGARTGDGAVRMLVPHGGTAGIVFWKT
jgi:hypothetical protein